MASTNWRQTDEDVNSINWLIISLVAGKWKLDVFSTAVFSNFSQKVWCRFHRQFLIFFNCSFFFFESLLLRWPQNKLNQVGNFPFNLRIQSSQSKFDQTFYFLNPRSNWIVNWPSCFFHCSISARKKIINILQNPWIVKRVIAESGAP